MEGGGGGEVDAVTELGAAPLVFGTASSITVAARQLAESIRDQVATRMAEITAKLRIGHAVGGGNGSEVADDGKRRQTG